MRVNDKNPMSCNDQSDQGLVVQTIVRLKMSLKRQLVKYIPTTGSKTVSFCWQKMREPFAVQKKT